VSLADVAHAFVEFVDVIDEQRARVIGNYPSCVLRPTQLFASSELA
jgi:hypothetical protein